MILEYISPTRTVKELHKQTIEQLDIGIESIDNKIDSKIDESIDGLKQDIIECIYNHTDYIFDRFNETNEKLDSISDSLKTMYSIYNKDIESLKNKIIILFIMIGTLLTINTILLISNMLYY